MAANPAAAAAAGAAAQADIVGNVIAEREDDNNGLDIEQREIDTIGRRLRERKEAERNHALTLANDALRESYYEDQVPIQAAADEADELRADNNIRRKTQYFIKRSIVGLTYINALMGMLEAISSSTADLDAGFFRAGEETQVDLIRKADETREKIFDNYSKIKAGTHLLYVRYNVTGIDYTLDYIKEVFRNPINYDNSIDHLFFKVMNNSLEYLKKQLSVIPVAGRIVLNNFEEDVNESFLLYMLNAYPTNAEEAAGNAEPAAYTAAKAARLVRHPPAAPPAAPPQGPPPDNEMDDENIFGGSFKIKPKVNRRKRNGSPRRKSLKRK